MEVDNSVSGGQLAFFQPVLIQRKLGLCSSTGRLATGLAYVLLWHGILVLDPGTVAMLPTEADITLDHEAVFFDATTGAVDQLLVR